MMPTASPDPSVHLSRRGLLRTSAFAGLGAMILAACGTEPEVAPTPSASEPVDLETEIVEALRLAGFDGDVPDYGVIIATAEVLTGPGRRMQMALIDETQLPAGGREVEVAIVRSGELEVVERISKPLYYDEGLGDRGVYVFETNLEATGTYFVIVSSDGHVGAAAINAIAPEQSAVVTFGAAVPSIATATVENPGDLEELCTRTPDCTMHDVSLDDALSQGKKVVLVIATPAYCVSAVCGPVVDVVQGVRDDLAAEADAADTVWIHAEVFKDAGNTPTAIVGPEGFNLPSEPWTFLVNSDGTLHDRFDGPVAASLLRASVAELS